MSDRLYVRELEGQLAIAKLLSRRLWAALSTRVDAAEIVWQRHHVFVQPCRVILDGGAIGNTSAGPSQIEGYIAVYPTGEKRNISRVQLLMMAGIDSAPGTDADVEVPF